MNENEHLVDAKLISPKPGDTLVVRLNEQMDITSLGALRTQFPDVPIIVIPACCNVDILPGIEVPFAGQWKRGIEHESQLTFYVDKGRVVITVKTIGLVQEDQKVMDKFFVNLLKCWPHPETSVSEGGLERRDKFYQRLMGEW